jgi:hypothetical protein
MWLEGTTIRYGRYIQILRDIRQGVVLNLEVVLRAKKTSQ